jgi:Na+-driven multidrug efflux pump
MKQANHLAERPVGELLGKFSMPAITGMLVHALYNVVDRIFVGQGVGSLAIAGITVGFPLMIIMMAVAALISLGATSRISLRLGEGRLREAEQIAGNALTLLVLTGGVLAAVCLVWLKPILTVFGASAGVMPYAVKGGRACPARYMWGRLATATPTG